jgi:hypothetical protein
MTAATTDISFAVGPHPSLFVQSELVPKEYRDQTISSNLRGHLKQHWLRIYACLDLSYADRLALRCMCRVFNEVEKILTLDEHRYKMLTPIPSWTYFPHPNYPTLNELMNKLNEEYAALPNIVWEVPTAAGALSLGMEVRVKYIRWGRASIKDATIQKVNDDETFDVAFDDGYRPRKNVPLNEIQIPNVSHSLSFFPCFVRCFAHISSSFLLFLFWFFFFFLSSSSFFFFFLFSFHIINR